MSGDCVQASKQVWNFTVTVSLRCCCILSRSQFLAVGESCGVPCQLLTWKSICTGAWSTHRHAV
eukprot:4120383-Heterocapsa_arctica.AAC.1